MNNTNSTTETEVQRKGHSIGHRWLKVQPSHRPQSVPRTPPREAIGYTHAERERPLLEAPRVGWEASRGRSGDRRRLEARADRRQRGVSRLLSGPSVRPLRKGPHALRHPSRGPHGGAMLEKAAVQPYEQTPTGTRGMAPRVGRRPTARRAGAFSRPLTTGETPSPRVGGRNPWFDRRNPRIWTVQSPISYHTTCGGVRGGYDG